MRTSRRWMTVAVLVFALMGGIGGALAASASSLPGDTLYPVKRSQEGVRLLLAASPDGRAELGSRLAEVRRAEVGRLAEAGRSADVRFLGVLDDLADGVWTVGGLRVIKTVSTTVVGRPQVDVLVEVYGRTQADGTITALRLTVVDQDDLHAVRAAAFGRSAGSGARSAADGARAVDDDDDDDTDDDDDADDVGDDDDADDVGDDDDDDVDDDDDEDDIDDDDEVDDDIDDDDLDDDEADDLDDDDGDDD